MSVYDLNKTKISNIYYYVVIIYICDKKLQKFVVQSASDKVWKIDINFVYGIYLSCCVY
jgi:hypothetical protein